MKSKSFLVIPLLSCALCFNTALGAVNSPASTEPTSLKKAISDTVLQAKVKMLLSHDKTLEPLKIAVTAKSGVVFLEGQVLTDAQYERAVALAESVDGIKNVDTSKFSIKDSAHPLSDILITAKVKGAILKDKIFTDKDIQYWPLHVETKDGVVFLSGQLDNQQQIANVCAIAKSVQGVKSIKDELTIAPKSSGADSHKVINANDVDVDK